MVRNKPTFPGGGADTSVTAGVKVAECDIKRDVTGSKMAPSGGEVWRGGESRLSYFPLYKV